MHVTPKHWFGMFAVLTLLTGACLYLPAPVGQAAHTPPETELGHETVSAVHLKAQKTLVSTSLGHPPSISTQPSLVQLARQLAKSGREEDLLQLKTLLGDPESEEGVSIALQLLRDTDIKVRVMGVDILTEHSLTNLRVHDEVVRLLTSETDPGILARLMNRLDAPIDLYGKDAEMSHALHNLLTHADPDVRSQAVLQLLQWDDYPTLEGFLYQALNDSSQEVRLSAATVISLIDTRSSTLKGALLSLRNNPLESRDMRESIDIAINRIEHFSYDYVR